MAGLVPAIHGCALVTDVDPRDKPGDDGWMGELRDSFSRNPAHARPPSGFIGGNRRWTGEDWMIDVLVIE
jgi:hypothetical protein